MLNHSDELFRAGRNDARPGAHGFDREHSPTGGEGVCALFLDDGGSVSLDRRQSKNPLGPFPCVDHWPAGRIPSTGWTAIPSAARTTWLKTWA